jgi:hypothetical protein
VVDLLNHDNLLSTLSSRNLIHVDNTLLGVNAMELITVAQIVKAIDGNQQAADWLRRLEQAHGYVLNEHENVPIALVEFI